MAWSESQRNVVNELFSRDFGINPCIECKQCNQGGCEKVRAWDAQFDEYRKYDCVQENGLVYSKKLFDMREYKYRLLRQEAKELRETNNAFLKALNLQCFVKERIYIYNLDAYIGYADRVAPNKLKFVREDTTHCWRVEKAMAQFNLLCQECDLYEVLVWIRRFERERTEMEQIYAKHESKYFDEWESFKRANGRGANDTLWISTTKVDGSYFWELVGNDKVYRREYEKLKKQIENF